MKKQIVPFWTWNKWKSPMTLTPKRVASHKKATIVSTFQKLSGIKFGRSGFKKMMAVRKSEADAKIWAEKFGNK